MNQNYSLKKSPSLMPSLFTHPGQPPFLTIFFFPFLFVSQFTPIKEIPKHLIPFPLPYSYIYKVIKERIRLVRFNFYSTEIINDRNECVANGV